MSAGRPLLYLPRGGGDERLVEGLRRGDVASYRQLYELYAPRLARMLQRLFQDPQLTQDTVQTTFLAVFRSVQQFDGRSTLLTWMTRIAIREGQRLWQRQARARRAADVLPPAAQEGRDQHEEREQVRLLGALIEGLPLEKRTALLLFEVEGFSVQEIADITGEPRGTVLARLSRTRAELREALRRRQQAEAPVAAEAPAAAADPSTIPRKSKNHV